MRILFLGDIVGRAGRIAVVETVPVLRRDLALDFVIVNGENAAGGFGINEEICNALFHAGVDCISTGNHAFDQRDKVDVFDAERRLLRPVNYPKGVPGRGVGLYETKTGKRVLVINAMGRTFMDPIDDPFAAVDRELEDCRLGWGCDAAVVDMHAEATSEKMSMGHYCDGRASLVVGTHSHVPTADAQVLTGGTAYQTDAGACADYDSVIGMEKTEPITRFVRKLSTGRMNPAQGPATVCGVFVETDDNTGLAKRIDPVRVGGRLKPTLPAS
ncbi:MAG: YmdB family metallophosphoesterase [Alphaproteobacteria bacterium]|nr:YmdB family metallophosphoesterase [Alphaproteobacteria bacterium]